MSQVDQYLLGYAQTEQERLQRQAQILAEETHSLLDQLEISPGARAVEIGCGPQGMLDLLSSRVGPSGTVTGVERSEDSVRLAGRFVADHKLSNVEVIHGDGRSTGLPRRTYDVAAARLVLVNVPDPEQIVAEMVALVRPGGVVALYEADWLGAICDPPLAAWDRIVSLLGAYSDQNRVDLFVGRKIPRLLREAGLVDVRVRPVVRLAPKGHVQRMLLPCFIENLRTRLLARQLSSHTELNDLVGQVTRHVEDPHTLVMGGLFFQAWGRRPGE